VPAPDGFRRHWATTMARIPGSLPEPPVDDGWELERFEVRDGNVAVGLWFRDEPVEEQAAEEGVPLSVSLGTLQAATALVAEELVSRLEVQLDYLREQGEPPEVTGTMDRAIQVVRVLAGRVAHGELPDSWKALTAEETVEEEDDDDE
jgi:hypothetical protein